MEDFSEHIDTSYDSEFKKLADQGSLSWYPWVGDRYRHANNKVLFVLESAYKNDSNRNTIETLNFERQSIHEVFIKGDTYSRTFNTIRKFTQELFTENTPSDAIWRSLAYHNVIQRPMDYTGKSREKPTDTDYADSLPCFKRILETLRPTLCICMGVTLAKHLLLNEYFKDSIVRSKTEPGKLNGVYKLDLFNLKLNTDSTKLIFTAHPANPKGFNTELWAKYIRTYTIETPKMIL